MSKQTIDSLCAMTSVRQFRSVICAAACLVAMNAGWAATWYVDASHTGYYHANVSFSGF